MENLNVERIFNYDEQLEKLLDEKLKKLVGNKKYASLLQVFRDNFLGFEKLVVFYQLNKNYGKEHNETAYGEIKKFLVSVGHIGSVDELSDSHISTYLNKIRKERNVEKRGRKKKVTAAAVGTSEAENFDRQSLPAQVENKPAVAVVEASPSHQKDWLDAGWIDEEPSWAELLVAGGHRPAQGEWSDDWENVWRHLYKKAAEAGLNDYEKTTVNGFKSIGADVGMLWLDLNKIRRALQTKYGWNAYGVGK